MGANMDAKKFMSNLDKLEFIVIKMVIFTIALYHLYRYFIAIIYGLI